MEAIKKVLCASSFPPILNSNSYEHFSKFKLLMKKVLSSSFLTYWSQKMRVLSLRTYSRWMETIYNTKVIYITSSLPLPLAFPYLILLIWRVCNSNLVMISLLASKWQDFKLRGLQFHFIKQLKNGANLGMYMVKRWQKRQRNLWKFPYRNGIRSCPKWPTTPLRQWGFRQCLTFRFR